MENQLYTIISHLCYLWTSDASLYNFGQTCKTAINCFYKNTQCRKMQYYLQKTLMTNLLRDIRSSRITLFEKEFATVYIVNTTYTHYKYIKYYLCNKYIYDIWNKRNNPLYLFVNVYAIKGLANYAISNITYRTDVPDIHKINKTRWFVKYIYTNQTKMYIQNMGFADIDNMVCILFSKKTNIKDDLYDYYYFKSVKDNHICKHYTEYIHCRSTLCLKSYDLPKCYITEKNKVCVHCDL